MAHKRSNKRREQDKEPVENKPPIPDITKFIREYFSSHENRQIKSKTLICQATDYIHVEPDDDTWGCGYRNIAMVFSAILRVPIFSNHLRKYNIISPPSLRRVQELIETAWQNGYDPVGCKEFEGKLIGKTNFVGTAEMWTLMRSLLLPCRMVDIQSGASTLVQFVTTHFTTKLDYTSAPSLCLPIYLQGDGHSKTIVGTIRNLDTLILLDPSSVTQRTKMPHIAECEKSLCRDISRLDKFSPKFQLLIIDEERILDPPQTDKDKRPCALKI
ncbi:putative Zinc finger-containing ubiquitin peptidase 1 [Blattamonas nauphoetae]|uniref:Zinc finger-containing ubiquitin peptidase 1 n=1 Tax=Blattamonas nauphoetae TaxID=2049346 RepID=A0ABQ9YL31_9EUKA|nr:putative Zinc finger-containing ubiquitin peptidase 1 [Blattamonas nauphoetae]